MLNATIRHLPKGVVGIVQSRIDWLKLTSEQKSFYIDALGDGLLAGNQVNAELGVNDTPHGMTFAGDQYIAFAMWVRTHKNVLLATMDRAAARNPRVASNIEFLAFNTYLAAHPKLAMLIVKRQDAHLKAMERNLKHPLPSPAASK